MRCVYFYLLLHNYNNIYMQTTRALILLSNDDGVTAKGLNELIGMLRPFGDLIVMAPDAGRSGAGMSLTSNVPVTFTLVRKEEGLTVCSCTGTPVDCVKLALEEVVPRKPDLVVGGINHGENAAVNAHYSGTMGIVFEGCLKGIPSMGLSLCDYAADADFSPCTPWVCRLTELLLEKGLPKGVCLNVNFPAGASYRGLKVCRQDKGDWRQEWEKGVRKNGKAHYWLSGYYESEEPDSTDTDVWALRQQYVTVTPTQIDLTAYGAMAELSSWFE